MKHSNFKIRMLISAGLMLGLGACKLELGQEIWLNEDNSGKARLEAEVVIPRMAEGDDESLNMENDNALQDYADRLAKNPGAVLSLYETSTNHNPDEFRYVYEMEFSFDNLQTLRNIICIDTTQGFNVDQASGYKLAEINPHNFLMQEESDIQEYISLMDVTMDLVLHLPSEPQKIDTKTPYLAAEKEVSWKFTLDQKWYKKPAHNILITF